MKPTGAEEANVSSHLFTLPVCPLTAIRSTVQRICFCTPGNFRMDLAIHDHSCQVPDHSYTTTHSGINTTVAGCPLPGTANYGDREDQDKEDAAEATAKKFRSFGLEVST